MNVAAYYEEATASLEEIFLRNRIPIAVGGSGFYMHTFIYGPPKGPPADQELRRKLEDDLEKFGLELLYQKLVALDPDYAASITMQDRHKVIRALEIILLTGKKVTEIPKTSEEDISSAFDFRCWFIYYPREILYKRIDDRCDAMIAAGLIEEVRSLRDALACNTAAANAIGYRQALTFLDSAQTQSDWNLFVQTFKQASRNYAKRQFTWFRKEPLFRWLDLSEMSMDHAAEILIHDLDRK